MITHSQSLSKPSSKRDKKQARKNEPFQWLFLPVALSCKNDFLIASLNGDVELRQVGFGVFLMSVPRSDRDCICLQ